MATRTRYTLRNDFHNTASSVVALDGVISARAMRRAVKQLCGQDGCLCGGTRGPQYNDDGTSFSLGAIRLANARSSADYDNAGWRVFSND